jgi:hypothetical protein
MDNPHPHPVEHPERRVIDALTLANWKATTTSAGTVEIAQGEPWPPGGAVAFERHTVTVPAPWPLADVRLELDVGADAVAVLHSRLGVERHPIGAAAPPLRTPTRAFGLRIEAHRAPPSVDDGTGGPHLGTTRLVLLEASETAEGRGPDDVASAGGG